MPCNIPPDWEKKTTDIKILKKSTLLYKWSVLLQPAKFSLHVIRVGIWGGSAGQLPGVPNYKRR